MWNCDHDHGVTASVIGCDHGSCGHGCEVGGDPRDQGVTALMIGCGHGSCGHSCQVSGGHCHHDGWLTDGWLTEGFRVGDADWGGDCCWVIGGPRQDHEGRRVIGGPRQDHECCNCPESPCLKVWCCASKAYSGPQKLSWPHMRGAQIMWPYFTHYHTCTQEHKHKHECLRRMTQKSRNWVRVCAR